MTPAPPPSLRRTVLGLALVLLLDPVLFGDGLLAALAFFPALALLLGAGWALARGRRAWARSRILRCGCWVLFMVLAVGVVRLHQTLAEARARNLVRACEAFKARRGAYPARLQDLVPEFVAAVPSAKTTIVWGQFMYLASAGPPPQHVLVYVAVPPSGRKAYSLEDGTWSQMPD